MLHRVGSRFLPILFVAAVLGASFAATPLGVLRNASASCQTGYAGGPAVYSLSFSSGTTAGGTSVVISGCAFTGATSVAFGGVVATSFTVESDTEIDAVSPPHAAGAVDVTVTTPHGTSATSPADNFTYVRYAAGHRCTSARLIPSRATAPAGSTVQFRANSIGCPNPRYEFFVRFPNLHWYRWRSFSSNPVLDLSTHGFRPGSYLVRVWVIQAGRSTRVPQAIATSVLYLTGCRTARIAPTSVTQTVGSDLQFVASSTGCPAPVYKFVARYPNGAWHVLQAFGGPTLDWSTQGLRPGTYVVRVWANQAGAYAGAPEAYAQSVVRLTGCTAASIAPSRGSTYRGDSVTFNASSRGCPDPQFEWWIRDPRGRWHRMTDFSSTSDWTWSTAGWAYGTYVVRVWANQTGGYTGSYEALGSATRVVAVNYCGAPANPWHYSFCGSLVIYSPPTNFCSYFHCIPSFWRSTNGYVVQCADLLFSHSGGRQGACSSHGGEYRILYRP